MSKGVLLGIAAFGGLILVGVLLSDTPAGTEADERVEAVAELTVPSDLPPIPIYPATTVRNVMDATGENGRTVTLSLGADATVQEVNEWYRAALQENGWGIKSDRNVGGYTILQAENGNLYTSMQAASGEEAGQVVISQQIIVRP